MTRLTEFTPTEETMQTQDTKAAFDAMREALEQAIARIEVANREGNPIMSAWLPDAKAALALAKGEP